MKHLAKAVLILALTLLPTAAFAQLDAVIFEAESGTIGSQFTAATDSTVSPAVDYIGINTTIGGENPTSNERVATYTVTFPHAGVWQLYARMRVGPANFDDDSMFYANGFGIKNPTLSTDWITANNLASGVGHVDPTDRVVGNAGVPNGVWKWVRLSTFDGFETPISFTVPEGGLTQTFQIAGRENGLWLDKFAFGPEGVFFTVFDLDNDLPGTTDPPPPPYTPPGPPIATDQPKFLGCAWSTAQAPNFDKYWNQVTPENAGKWGSVEATRDVMDWTQLDTAYALARSNGFVFRLHTLIWGAQQPAWIETLPDAEQREEIEEWFAELAAKYDFDQIDVVNEPLHDPPNQPGGGGGNYINALGGSGSTGWDWVLESFRLARQYFPEAKLGLNDFSITNTNSSTMTYLQIIDLLKAEDLIDYIGVQGHAFSTRGDMATHTANLNRLAATGLPIYVTELDIDGPSDEIQLADYMRIFPTFWEHPGVRGITPWGYRPGHWRTAQGAYIVHDNGAERPAMQWLLEYVPNAVLPPWIEQHPISKTAASSDDVSFTCEGNGTDPLEYQWEKDGTPIEGNPTATTSTLTLEFVTPADAGSYACVVSNGAGSATSNAAKLTIATGLSRHAPAVAGVLSGSIQQLSAENVTIGGTITGDLLVPGTPQVIINGKPSFGGTVNGDGESSPTGYSVTINGGAAVGRVVRRTDPVSFPAIVGPPAPTGTRDVVLSSPGADPGDFETVRDLTLKENVGQVAVPPGTYGEFSAGSNSGFTFGVADATEPSVYNLQGLTLKAGSRLNIVGPVIVNLGAGNTVGGTAGSAGAPEWLTLNVAGGEVTVNGVAIHGFVIAPESVVTVNTGGTITGGVKADRLVIKDGGAVRKP